MEKCVYIGAGRSDHVGGSMDRQCSAVAADGKLYSQSGSSSSPCTFTDGQAHFPISF